MAHANNTLTEKVIRRFDGLKEADVDTFHESAKRFFLFFDNEPKLRALSAKLRTDFPMARPLVLAFLDTPDLHLKASTEAEEAAMGEAALGEVVKHESPPRQLYDAAYYRKSVYRDESSQKENDIRSLSTFRHKFLEPFETYVLEQLEDLEVSQSPIEMDDLLPISARRGYDAKVNLTVTEALEKKHPVSLIFIDLDNFKSLNDTYGHNVGDQVLIGVSNIIRDVVGTRGQAFRLGGEEIGVLLPNHTALEASQLAERIRKAISAAPISDRSLTVSASMGVAEIPTHANDPKELYENADKAMYDSKRLGRDLVRIYGEPEPSLETNAKVSGRETRKLPDPACLTEDMKHSIRQNYFQSGVARCPIDSSQLEVHKSHVAGRMTADLFILCPMCGMNSELRGPN